MASAWQQGWIGMPCTNCSNYYDPITGSDTPIRWLNPGNVIAGPSPPAIIRQPAVNPGVWCKACNCAVRVLICECVREELLARNITGSSWRGLLGHRGVCSRGGHDICLPTQQETTALNATRLRALQKWRRDLKNELVPQLLRAHGTGRPEIAKKVLLYVGFDHPWKIY